MESKEKAGAVTPALSNRKPKASTPLMPRYLADFIPPFKAIEGTAPYFKGSPMNNHVRSPDGFFGSTLIKFDTKPGTGRFSIIPNSWSDAWLDSRMSDQSMKIVHFFCRKMDNFKITQRSLASHMGFGLETTNKALLNLHSLGVAKRLVWKGKTKGFEINMNIEIPPLGKEAFRRVENLETAKGVSGSGTRISRADAEPDAVSDTGSDTLYNTKSETPSSLRSSETRKPSQSSGSARSAGSIRVERDGQIGIGFEDSQGVIPDRDIIQIMAALRQENLGGDPEDFELREHVLSRIEFMTRRDFKGRPMVRGDKTVAAANRAKVVKFCMAIISKPDFRWKTKRIDPAIARRRQERLDQIAAEIARIKQEAGTVVTRSGLRISSEEHLQILYAIKDKREEVIRSRISRCPSSYVPSEWRKYLEQCCTDEAMAKMLYGAAMDDKLSDDWREQEDQMQARLSKLQAEETQVRLHQ